MSHIEVQAPRVQNFEELNRYLEEMIFTISQAFNETDALDLRVTHVAPHRPRDGMIVHADGTDWNPGEGRGLYIYDGGWVRLARVDEMPVLGGATWDTV